MVAAKGKATKTRVSDSDTDSDEEEEEASPPAKVCLYLTGLIPMWIVWSKKYEKEMSTLFKFTRGIMLFYFLFCLSTAMSDPTNVKI